MRVDGITQTPVFNSATDSQNLQVIDEKQIKTILFLGIKGDIKIKPENGRGIDTYA
jgi:hypothetical protein